MIESILYRFHTIPDYIRHIFLLSNGYAGAVLSTMLMQVLLPVILSQYIHIQRVGVAMTCMTLIQIGCVAPIASYLGDKYSARMMLFCFGGSFLIGAILWMILGYTDPSHIYIQYILLTIMILLFAIGYGCKLLDTYIMRITPAEAGGKSFAILMTMIGIGRLIGVQLEPMISSNMIPRAPGIMIVAMSIYIVVLSYLPTDTHPATGNISSNKGMSILGTIHRGIEFIRKSHYFALFGLGVSIFEGLLMSGLYFMIPLAHHNHYITNTSIYGREIGIHKLIAILFALTAGIIADRFARRKLDIGGWIVVLIGIGIMIYDPLGYGLIIGGAIVAVGYTLVQAIGNHLLEVHDMDHDDDAAYDTLKQIVLNIGFIVMPIACGLGIQYYGFEITIQAVLSLVGLVGIAMLIWGILYRYDLLSESQKDTV